MDFSIIFDNLPLLFKGLGLTLQLLIISLIAGFVISIPLSIMAASKTKWARIPAKSFIYVFRGTPLLIQIFIIYYGLSQFEWLRESLLWGFFKEAYWCAILAFALNTAAYTAEIFRGAIVQTPKGEIEAAVAYGMSRWDQYRHVILPSALRRSIPMYGNEVIFMLHATVLAGVITLVDLFGAAKILNSRYYAPFESFISAGLFYLVITFTIVFIFKLIEGHFLKHLKR
ncbi:ABC transporter permease [Cocleimonas flava]|uniref:Arginine ABC transporter permease protein ArtM n=1 Tax=Cocleimonas flava TaxID=634765 RepID=A0A4R1EUU1_9GAMM|nr:ABC transporter permease [Cocleimonas flava]TCJ85033.1 amino acid ABC transporter membrane protein 2 (PAAT family) [Cocleimonas flava]